MQEVDIPDIFDVLEGGEDESAVKFLLGFNAEDATGTIAVDPTITIATCGSEMLNSGILTTTSPLPPATMTAASAIHNKPPARVVVQIEPPGGQRQPQGSQGGQDKPRKREPVDPSRCIYDCDSCGKAFTTKFNLKRHINMHCSRSREAGVPLQGPPSASQPSRKTKASDVGQQQQQHQQQTKAKHPRLAGNRNKTNKVVQPSSSANQQQQQQQPSTLTYQVGTGDQAMAVHLTVNAQTSANSATTCTVTNNRSTIPQLPIRTIVAQPKPAGGLPVQPLPESTVQMIQNVVATGNTGTVTTSCGTQRIVRVISAPQQLLTQKGGTVQLQAVPMSPQTIQFPTQPVPIVHQLVSTGTFTGTTRHVVVAQSAAHSGLTATTTAAGGQTALPVMAANISTIMPRFAATAVAAHRATATTADNNILVRHNPAISASIVSTSLPLVSEASATSTVASPHGFNDHPPAELFDSEDGDALSVATTTETPTPPPYHNGDGLHMGIAAVKSQPGSKVVTVAVPQVSQAAHVEKVVVMPQPQQQLMARMHSDEEDDDEDDRTPFSNTANLLPTNRFHGQLMSIPKGWLRKVVTMSKGFQKVFYYNPVGKRFSCQEEIDQYFARLGYSVGMSLFNFELPKLVDEDEEQEEEDEDDEDEDNEEDEDEEEDQQQQQDNKKNGSKDSSVVVKVTSNAKGQATVTPARSSGGGSSNNNNKKTATVVATADTTVSSSGAAASSSSASCSPTNTASKMSAASFVSTTTSAKTELSAASKTST